jgi:hypothetical protein
VLWYYRSVSAVVDARLGPAPLAGELARAASDLARFVEALPARER